MADDFFNEIFSALTGDDWDEQPVEIEEFVTSEEFLNLPPLSEYQYQMIRAASQIYKYETLVSLYGEEKAGKRWRQTCNEIILQLGKGSGKDYTSTIACCYIVYLLLCLKDPARYYGKPAGDAIDIVNVAINAEQAKNVFFKGFKNKIKSCPWFEGKFYEKNNSIEFDKAVTVYSGHSEREAFEGLNLLVAILDEISGFALESASGNEQAKTADAVYKMYRASVDSRFPDYGKVLLLSFPRFKGDYIQQRYDAAIAEKEVIVRTHTFKIDPDLPDGTDGNEFEIEWEEDHIVKYAYPHLFALKRPTWEVNPTVSIDSPAMIRAFSEDPADALGRFACQPSDNVDSAFFKNKEAIENSFVAHNGVDDRGVFWEGFTPKADTKYFVHVDLAKVHDRCAVAVAHVENWVTINVNENYSETYPVVQVDAVRWWKPSKDQPMDYKEVEKFILDLKKRGFELRLVTFDRWQSNDTMNILKQYHINTEILSVANKHYDDFLSVMYDKRLVGPAIPELVEELRMLRYINGKVDHPRSGYKDLSDAVCGAIYNAVSLAKKPVDREIEVVSYQDIIKQQQAEHAEQRRKGVIVAPKRDMPQGLADYLASIKML